MAEEDDGGGSGSPWRALVGLVVLVLACVAVWFVMQQLRQSSEMQDCLASGRTNCAPVGR